MNVTRHIIIDAPLDKVWDVAAHEFDNISAWASLVFDSKATPGTPAVSGPEMAGRVCDTRFGKTSERFQTFDAKTHTFSYTASAENQPGFIKSGSNTWTLEAVSSVQTRLSMAADMELNLFPGLLMRFPMSFQMGKLLDMNLEEIKHYIETGRPHPRKAEAMRTATAK